jgi:hypothetical protein
MALEQLLARDGIQMDDADDRAEAAQRRLAAFARVAQGRLAETIEISEDAVRDAYQADPEAYVRPASVVLWNIYRRHADPGQAEPTYQLLQEIRQRVQRGETFASLAREYSQSETRLRDGFVGSVEQGRMAPALDDAAFALDRGGVSDPIDVPGGAVLLHISERMPEVRMTLEDARRQIEGSLRQTRLADMVDDLVAGMALPDDALVLDADALLEALRTGDADAIVLRIGPTELRAEHFTVSGMDLSDADTREALVRGYEAQLRVALLGAYVEVSAEPWAQAIRAELAERLDSVSRMTATERWVRSRMDALLTAEPERVQNYFEDNRSSYQTPLAFNIVSLDIPLRGNPDGLIGAMDAQAFADAGGGLAALEALAERYEGAVTDHQWVAFDELSGLFPNKATGLIVQTETGGVTPYYQHDDALHLLWIKERREPQARSFTDVQDKASADYIARFAKQMSTDIREERLRAADYRFQEAIVRQLLQPPGAVTGGP